MNPLSAGVVFGGRKGAGLGVKRLSSGFWNATGRSTRKSSQTPPGNRYRPRSGARWSFGSIIYSDGWRGYDGLVDRGHKKHFHVNQGQHEFARGDCPINGIESF